MNTVKSDLEQEEGCRYKHKIEHPYWARLNYPNKAYASWQKTDNELFDWCCLDNQMFGYWCLETKQFAAHII